MDEQGTGSGGRRNWRDLYRPSGRPSWLTTPILVIIGIVIIVALVFLGRWIHHSLKQSPSTTAGNSGQTVPKIPEQQPAGSTSGSGGPSTGSASKPSSAGQTAQLPNNGPGNVVAVFLASSLGAAGLHYVVRARKNG